MKEKAILSVAGMKCGGCETSIGEKLKALEGVLSVSASHKDNRVEVEFDTDQIDIDAIEEAIEDAGFTVE
ncbi:MAG: hypothetical protein Kow0065_12430 [Methylomicrobium sp.]